MIYRDYEDVPDPLYEVIFWAIYKEMVILGDYIGIVDMEEKNVDIRLLTYLLCSVSVVLAFATPISVASLLYILKIIN